MKHIKAIRNFIGRGTRTLLAFIAIFGTAAPATAADYYWVGGSGNWSDYANHWATSSGGTIFHTSIPSLNDDVYFDAASFTAAGQSVVLDSTFIYCRTMDWTGAQFNPALVRQPNKRINIYGSLILNDNMSVVQPTFHFVSALPGNTIYTGNISTDTLYFTGGGTWDMTGPVLYDRIEFTKGILNTNGFDLTGIYFNIVPAPGDACTLNLDTSVVTVSDLYGIFGVVYVNGANATVVTQAPGAWNSIYLDNDTLGTIIATNNLSMAGSVISTTVNINNNLYLDGSSGNDMLKARRITIGNSIFTSDSIVADTLIMLGAGASLKFNDLNIGSHLQLNSSCGDPVTLEPNFQGGSGSVYSSATITLTDVIINNITASGGGTFTANNSLGIGNTTGWNINTPLARDLYWVGGSGNWSDPASWSLTSGGTGGNCPPTPSDNVYFDGNSFTGPADTVKMNVAPIYCNNMSWAGSTGSPRLIKTAPVAGDVEISGSFTGLNGLQMPIVIFNGNTNGNNLTSNGSTFNSLTFTGSGAWEMTDDLSVESSIYCSRGSFSTNGYGIRCNHFLFGSGTNNPTIDLDTSTVFCGERFTAGYNSVYNLSALSAKVIVKDTVGFSDATVYGNPISVGSVTFLSSGYVTGNLTIGKLTATAGFDSQQAYFTAGHLELGGSARMDSCIVDTLTFNSPGSYLRFSNLTVNDQCSINGVCGNPVIMEPYEFVTTGVLTKPSGTVNINYCTIDHITATGGASFIAANCYDLGGNTGWTINSPAARSLYWVGGTGNWSDDANWALSSGGTGGNCAPSILDAVYFDSNSFTGTGDSVKVDLRNISVGTMDWTGSLNSPRFVNAISGGLPPQFQIAGSLLLEQGMTFSYSGEVRMHSAGTNTILTNGVSIASSMYFNGGGTWNLADDITAGSLYFTKATFNSNNHNIDAHTFRYESIFNNFDTVYFNLGTSNISVYSFRPVGYPSYMTGAPQLYFKSGQPNELYSNGNTYSSILFQENATVSGDITMSDLTANKNLNLLGGTQLQAGTIILKGNLDYTNFGGVINTGDLHLNNPGKTVELGVLNVTNYLTTTANGGFPVLLQGINGSAGTISKASGIVCLDHMLIQNINATGGAQFFAGASSVDLGGNSGWTYSTCTVQPPDVWPGDANYDLGADNTDILNIGLAYGYAGPVRAGATLNWNAQPASDWQWQFANAANLKHADTDGNGVVNDDDTTAVALNYGLTHPPRLMPPAPLSFPVPSLYVVANPDTAQLSDTVQVDIYLGTSSVPVDSIYGIAFTINIDTALVNTSYLSVDYTGCWMGNTATDLIGFHKNLMVQNGKIDVALVRNDQQNIGGNGFLMSTGIVVVDNVGAKITLPVTLSDITAITASEYLLSIFNAGDSILIDTTGTVGLGEISQQAPGVSLHPQPANQILNVTTAQNGTVDYEIYSVSGALIDKGEKLPPAFSVNTGSWERGIYFIKLKMKDGTVVRRLEIIRN